jgi:3-oxoacyl-[acyl-carrier protein] reductase
MDVGLRGRVAVVAAASKGIGRACALAFAAEGASVAICARGEEALRATEAELLGYGVGVRAAVADVSKTEDCKRFVEGAAGQFGRVDVLVTNAGGPPSGPFDSFDEAAYRSALEVNFLATMRLCYAAIPHMRRGRWGRIVNITSVAARQPLEGLILSNSARLAVVGFAKTLSNELAREGITVNTVCPGPTMTDRIRSLAQIAADRQGVTLEEAVKVFERDIPLGRLGTPEEVAALVLFLAGEPAAYITGTTIAVDGGLVRSPL